MKKVFIAINILLFVLIFFEGWRFFRVWKAESALSFMGPRAVGSPALQNNMTGEKSSHSAGRVIGKQDKKRDTQIADALSSDMSFEREGEKILPLRESFAGIIGKNLFHIQRREGAEEIKTEPALSKAKPKPIIMEGIVIIGNYRAAVIKDTAPQVKGGRPTRKVRVGDIIEDQKVIAIMEEQIIVKGEEGERVIKLNDSDKPMRLRTMERTEAAPAQAVPSEMPPVPLPQTP